MKPTSLAELKSFRLQSRRPAGGVVLTDDYAVAEQEMRRGMCCSVLRWRDAWERLDVSPLAGLTVWLSVAPRNWERASQLAKRIAATQPRSLWLVIRGHEAQEVA